MNLSTKTKLTTFSLVMLMVGAIDSVRNLPSTALFGSALIFFFIFSAIVFLIPSSLVSAELAATYTEKSGIYHWTKLAFGEKSAFLAIWLQWINTMVWFPTILSANAGTLAYLINPNLAQNKFYLISIILGTFWILTIINLKGIKTSAKFSNYCAIAGTLVPIATIIILAAIWIYWGKPLQIHLTATSILPNFNQSENWISLTAIMTSFLGMELTTVHVKEIDKPQKTFPKSLLIAVVIILVTMIFGALAIAFVMPQNKINLINGVMQAFDNFFAIYHIGWAMPLMALLLTIGNFGGIISWVISPAKGLLQAAQTGYLPKFLQKENKHGVAHNLLIAQAVLVSIICLAFLLMPSVNGSYWLLSDLSTQLYMLMYVIMFFAAVILKYKSATHSQKLSTHFSKPAFTIPGGKLGTWITCVLGLIGCIITLIVGFFPPDGVNVGTTLHYEIIFSGGIVTMILPILFFYAYKEYQNKQLAWADEFRIDKLQNQETNAETV